MVTAPTFFRCKFCGRRAGSLPDGHVPGLPGGAVHEDPACEGYKRMTSEAYCAAHADAERMANQFGGPQIIREGPDLYLEDEN